MSIASQTGKTFVLYAVNDVWYHSLTIIGASLREPHINVKFVWLVCLYVHDTKIYKNSSNLRGTFSC